MSTATKSPRKAIVTTPGDPDGTHLRRAAQPGLARPH